MVDPDPTPGVRSVGGGELLEPCGAAAAGELSQAVPGIAPPDGEGSPNLVKAMPALP